MSPVLQHIENNLVYVDQRITFVSCVKIAEWIKLATFDLLYKKKVMLSECMYIFLQNVSLVT